MTKITTHRRGKDRPPSAVTPKAHEAEHRSGGSDAIAGALALAAIPDHMSKSKLAFTTNKLLKGQGAGVDPIEIDPPGDPYYTVSASDTVLASADTERHETSTTWTKKKEIIIGLPGEYRITFDLKSDYATHDALGKIYKNGVAYGTEQSVTGTTYVTKSEDLTFSEGDLIQLYIRGQSSGDEAFVRNFKVKATVGTAIGVVVTD